MKNALYTLFIILGSSTQLFSQSTLLTPLNTTIKSSLIKSETSEMTWYMVKDSLKIPISHVQTKIQKEKEKLRIITTVKMKQSLSPWIDSTIVALPDFKPLYHSSYNQQRDMVLHFGEKITGYYLDKASQSKTNVSEKTDQPFFDSSFYPQLLRFLPLKKGYSATLSIFDYNPKSKIGVVKATVKTTGETTIKFQGKNIKVWKVQTTDDISNNSSINTYYIDSATRKILRQEIEFGGRKMLMELKG